MARRSSARLRERSTTPKRVSLSHDAITRTPRTMPAKLSSLQESDEMPGAFPSSVSPSENKLVLNPVIPKNLATPSKATPIKPSEQEMHPQLHHQSTAKPLDEARHLGFSNMGAHTEPPRQTNRLAMLQGTPTRARDLQQEARSPSYHFTFRREHSLELSPEAKALMYEKREEAAKIREQMIADGEGPQPMADTLSRRKATPKGRFSSAHDGMFEKMDSIAGHASAYRAKQFKPVTSSIDEKMHAPSASKKSLKRSPSKAELDEAHNTPTRGTPQNFKISTSSFKGSAIPRSASTKDLKPTHSTEPSSPAKRVKRAGHEDVSATRLASSDEEKSAPTTPQSKSKPSQSNVSYPDLSALTTPTQSSLARAASIKSTKTSKIPAPQFTPAKVPTSILKKTSQFAEEKPATPLLHRSPSKPSFLSRPVGGETISEESHIEKPKAMMDPQHARTPAKSGMAKRLAEHEGQDNVPREKPAPLLARSPVKSGTIKSHHLETGEKETAATATPLLSRSPAKLPATNPFSTTTIAETPGNSMGSKLLGRFNLLRKSPMKSILRTPQRLYSDDPAKIAAGTHMATPPKNSSKSLIAAPPATAPVRKHVDFSSSTLARAVKAQSATPSTPTKDSTSSPKSAHTMPVPTAPSEKNITYPSLVEKDRLLSPSPEKRRQTSGPGDFTFRADNDRIVFESPHAPASSKKAQRPSTIRFISADAIAPPAPIAGSKKRKHEFEDRAVVEDMATASNKENTDAGGADEDHEDEQRPVKRMKPSGPDSSAKKAVQTKPVVERRTTLGVKPKGTKTVSAAAAGAAGAIKKRVSTTISQARLNALSQPKKRG
ncbi:unnamed protein product [Zymoseptoria tritici ST99CH_1E4]|nr:unnamed protein product [Zymoseptoria tritici ST99CH_1E4]